MSRLASAWRKLFGRGEPAPGEDSEEPAAPSGLGERMAESDATEQSTAAGETDPVRSPEERLSAVVNLEDPGQVSLACEAFDAIMGAGHAGRAITLGRRVLERSTGGDALRVRVAEAQVVRADDAGAIETLESLLARSDTSVPILAMAARALDR